jgi:hypothetical protein
VVLAGSIPHECSLLDTFVFVCWRYMYVDSSPGVMCFAQCLGTLSVS